MSIMVNVNMFADLNGQFDSDEEEDLEEDGFMQAAYDLDIWYLFSLVRYSQTLCYNFVCPPDVKKLLSSALPSIISPPTCDNDVHPRKRAHWTIFEEAVLIQFLFERKDKMNSRTMFKDTVFKRAAEALNRFHEKGGKKTSISCRSKWTKLKRTYKVVTALKSKSGFVWDDLKGMGVTAEKRPAWDKLVESNKQFKPFATNGWPHYEAMARLMPFRARSTYARRGTHRPIATTMTTCRLSSPPTPFDIPPSSIPSSCKRMLSSLDSSSQSSSSNERFLSPEDALALKQLKAAIETMEDCILDFNI
ncbi:hypothetical protein BGY98DRAFT_1010345 [Russula aff. rugulosa BPL654]|nr:hypothetical protein BGY98DRAFT_1010345 [Russula aff. rugulosa BPL654]